MVRFLVGCDLVVDAFALLFQWLLIASPVSFVSALQLIHYGSLNFSRSDIYCCHSIKVKSIKHSAVYVSSYVICPSSSKATF